MIYFLQPVDGGPIKIGHSGDVDARHVQLEAYYKRPLSLLGTMEGGREEEQALHARFAHLRLGKKEQFKPAPDLMAFIGKPLLVSIDPDAVEAMRGVFASTVVELDPATHHLLRKVAADVGISMAAFARDAVIKVIKEEAKARGIKH